MGSQMQEAGIISLFEDIFCGFLLQEKPELGEELPDRFSFLGCGGEGRHFQGSQVGGAWVAVRVGAGLFHSRCRI